MLQKQKFFFVLFVIDLQRLRDMRGCGNLAFSAWKNGHVDFPHTFDATPGLSAGSVHTVHNMQLFYEAMFEKEKQII